MSRDGILSRALAGLLGSPKATFAAIVCVLLFAAAILAPVIAPQNPYDLGQIDMFDARLPPGSTGYNGMTYWLGTDAQGRDMLSVMLYGTRTSVMIGIASVAFSLLIGLSLGLIAGYFGGIVDNILMRIGDVVLSIPTILIAILVSAVVRQMLPPDLREIGASAVLVLAITISGWVQYARTVRAQSIVERGKEYVMAAKLLNVPARRIMARHILPNTLTPVLVAATLSFGMAILTEATLSFLGIGMPPGQPSLGTLIRVGNQYLFSGLWWMVIFPVLQLSLLVVSVNLLGDWLRDALNPRLR